MNTFKKLHLTDNSVVDLTLNFARLYQLKAKRPNEYKRYNSIYSKKEIDHTFDSILILYVAYLCANVDDLENTLSEAEFMELLPPSFTFINNLVAELTHPKLPVTSETHL